MRKQSWQVRLIPLFYCTGIIKGLSNYNYAPKVDTLLSCWHGVAVRCTCVWRKQERMGARVCNSAWWCEEDYGKTWSQPNYESQNTRWLKSHLSAPNNVPVKSDQNSDNSFWRGNTIPLGITHTEHLAIHRRAGGSQSWHLCRLGPTAL